jgi:ABC-type transport system involved in multi-copper enzyme maturation permease subunit
VRLSLIVGVGLLYLAAFLALAVFVSTVTHHSSHSFLWSLVIWITMVLIVPPVSVLAAGRAVTVPSVDEINAQKAAFGSTLWKSFREDLVEFPRPESDDMQAIMASFQQYQDSLTTEREKKMMEFAGRLNEDRHSRQVAQEKTAFTLARFSPAAAVALAASALAGTSLDLKNHYHDQAMAYQKSYADFIRKKTGMVPGGRMMIMRIITEDGEKPKPIDPAELPAFEWRGIALTTSLRSAVIDIGLLALYTMIFFAASFVAFLRYDVR